MVDINSSRQKMEAIFREIDKRLVGIVHFDWKVVAVLRPVNQLNSTAFMTAGCGFISGENFFQMTFLVKIWDGKRLSFSLPLSLPLLPLYLFALYNPIDFLQSPVDLPRLVFAPLNLFSFASLVSFNFSKLDWLFSSWLLSHFAVWRTSTINSSLQVFMTNRVQGD